MLVVPDKQSCAASKLVKLNPQFKGVEKLGRCLGWVSLGPLGEFFVRTICIKLEVCQYSCASFDLRTGQQAVWLQIVDGLAMLFDMYSLHCKSSFIHKCPSSFIHSSVTQASFTSVPQDSFANQVSFKPTLFRWYFLTTCEHCSSSQHCSDDIFSDHLWTLFFKPTLFRWYIFPNSGSVSDSLCVAGQGTSFLAAWF